MDVSLVSAIKISLTVGLLSTLLAFVPAIFFGWLMANKEFKGKTLLNILLFFPLVSPPVVTGFLLLKIFGRHSRLGLLLQSFGIEIPFTILGATLAALIVGFPLFVMATRATFMSLDPNLERYAESTGYSPFMSFMKVTLPLSFPGILAGSIMSFARSLGEFGATVILAGNMEGETRTIPMAIYTLLDAPNKEGEANTLLLASLGISLLALIAYEICNRYYWKKIEWKRS